MIDGTGVRRLGREHADLVADVLSEAFRSYPVMLYVLRGLDEYESKLRALVHFFVMARAYRDEPMLGIGADGGLDAAAILSYPALGTDPAPELEERKQQLWKQLGHEAEARYAAFGEAGGRVTVDVPQVHLNMIGVRPSLHGRGLARPLLERVHAISTASSHSDGVTLTTENPTNVALYEHFGYVVTGHERVAPDLETWGMFRPDTA